MLLNMLLAATLARSARRRCCRLPSACGRRHVALRVGCALGTPWWVAVAGAAGAGARCWRRAWAAVVVSRFVRVGANPHHVRTCVPAAAVGDLSAASRYLLPHGYDGRPSACLVLWERAWRCSKLVVERCSCGPQGGRAAVEVAHEAWLQQGEGAGGQEPRGGQEMKQHKGRAQQQQRKQKQKKEEGKEEAEAGQEGGAKKRRTGGGHGEEEGVSGAVGAGAEVGDALTSAGGQQGGAGNGGKGGGNAEGKQQDVKEEQQQQQRGKEEAKGTEADGLQQDADELAPRRRSTRAAATKASAALRAGAVPTAAGGTKTDGRRSNQSCSGPATAAAGSSDQSKEGGRGQGALASTAGAPGETAATTEGQLPRVVGVLLLSYPLHPPGNTVRSPQRMRALKGGCSRMPSWNSREPLVQLNGQHTKDAPCCDAVRVRRNVEVSLERGSPTAALWHPLPRPTTPTAPTTNLPRPTCATLP